MALSPQLLQFKSSGVYRLEFDKSQTANINVDTLRLIVGHSRKGPYNTPVLIDNTENFRNVFGSIDRNLERKGMFFHRSAIEALSRGPILALNVSSFDKDDKGYYAQPITNGSVDSLSALSNQETLYSNFFDMDKFMTPSDAKVLKLASTANQLINFVNIKQSGITVFVRKAQNVSEFNITAREWYGAGEVPAFMNDFDYISDYMIDVFVFKGEFNPSDMNTDPVYSAFFTDKGLLKSQLNQFANLRQVTLEAQYTGSLIPGFKDLEGRNLYIESIINAEARRTGLFCAVNEDAVIDEDGTGLDLVGHTVDVDQDYELLSYVVGQTTTNGTLTTLTLGAQDRTVVGDTLTITDVEEPTNLPNDGEFLMAAIAGEYVEVTSHGWVANAPGEILGTVTIKCDGNINASYATVSTSLQFLNVSNSRSIAYDFAGGAGTYTVNGTSFEITTTGESIDIAAGDYIKAASGRLAKVQRVGRSGAGTYTFTIYCDVAPAATWSGYYFKSFESATSIYKPFVLPAAALKTKEISDCLNVLVGGNGVYNTLIDKDAIDFRYVVDTFTSYDSTGILNKAQLSQLAMDRQNASAILNAPTVADFKASTDPSFTDANGTFNTAYIAQGGNLDKNPTEIYALPSIIDGANYAFYYGPGLIVSDNGKDIIVPPAAYVANNYLDKYTTALPWSIVAGPRRGVVSGINVKGAEYSFDKADRDVLEPFGINPIVFQRGVGLTITGNKTAQQSIKSALSSAHVREALIYIQEGIADILKDYVFEFNNVQTRLEIKTVVDSFMESVKQDGGVFEYRNIMDQSNNTDDVIDQNFGIIDTYVEPVKGLEIVVHRTTVLNTGEISTGNFL
jgi:hypothetical protein